MYTYVANAYMGSVTKPATRGLHYKVKEQYLPTVGEILCLCFHLTFP